MKDFNILRNPEICSYVGFVKSSKIVTKAPALLQSTTINTGIFELWGTLFHIPPEKKENKK